MTKKLLLDLPLLPDQPVHWLVWDDGRELASGSSAPEKLDFLAERYAGVACYALINGQAVSHHRIVLPKAGRVGMAALPFQLEERLCTDLDQVHIAHTPIRANQPCDVLVIDKDVMTRCHEWLCAAGLKVTAMLPDFAVLPANVLVLDRQRASAHLAAGGAALDSENFPVWWQIAAGDQVPSSHDDLQVFTEAGWQPDYELPEGPGNPFNQRLQVYAEVFAPWNLNLLCGAYAIKEQRSAELQLLRWPLLLLVAVLLVHWAALGVQIMTANSRAEQLDRAMDALYQQTFPGARVVNARAQMRTQLAALEGGSSEQSQLLPWLERLASATKNQKIDIKQMTFEHRPTLLKVQVTSPGFEQLDQWVAALSAQGFNVERGAFNQEAAAIVGQVVLRGEGQ